MNRCQPNFSTALVVAIAIAAGPVAIAADNAGVVSGVTGRVTVSPAGPGAQRMGNPASAPLGGKDVRMIDDSGTLAGQATTAPDGRFAIYVPAGAYELRVVVNGAFPRCKAAPVSVRQGQLTAIDLACDSGMR